MITITDCNCGCYGYVVECDYCRARSTRCSDVDIEGARVFAEKKGWVVRFPRVGESGKWVCPFCQEKAPMLSEEGRKRFWDHFGKKKE